MRYVAFNLAKAKKNQGEPAGCHITFLATLNPKDGTCRSCNGELEIVGVTDATMEVTCQKCGDEYEVETDAFNDGSMTYHVGFLAEQARRGEVAL